MLELADSITIGCSHPGGQIEKLLIGVEKPIIMIK
jgi:hypothetical protein